MVKHLTPRKRAEIRGMHWAGATTREIANHFKRPMRTVQHIIKTFTEREDLVFSLGKVILRT